MMRNIRNYLGWTLWLGLATCVLSGRVHADRVPPIGGEAEADLIGVLKSDAPKAEKAITCKRLAYLGTKTAVPALAPLLLDADLASWARIALEAIPGPEADDALLDAVGKLQGRLLVGTINSIGYRRNAQAVGALGGKLSDADPEVISAAAEALGKIGGEDAAQLLQQALTSAPTQARAAVAEGCVMCAERLLADGKQVPSAKLYDAVREASVPKNKQLEGLRGAILARGLAGLPLLIGQLDSTDKATFGMALRAARELEGREVTEALAAELAKINPGRKVPLLLALADRNDAGVLPAVLKAAQSDSKPMRIAAVGALDRLGNVSCVPVLLSAASEQDADLSKAAKTVLARLPGREIDSALLDRLSNADGKTRQVLLELAAQRRIAGAVATALQWAQDSETGVRRAALDVVGAVGEEKQTGDLVALLGKTTNSAERRDIEKAILALTARWHGKCASYLLPLCENSDPGLRALALRTLASVGGADALAAVKKALSDSDESVQDEAVRTLSNWAGSWPDDAGVSEPLLDMAKNGKKLSHQILGLRGYLQYVQAHKDFTDDQRVAKVNELLPLITRAEEKRLAIAVISGAPTASALELLMGFAADPAIAEEACLPIVTIAGGKTEAAKELRQKALALVVDKTSSDSTRRKAQRALRALE